MKAISPILLAALLVYSCKATTTHTSATATPETTARKSTEIVPSPQTKDTGLSFKGDFRNALWGQSKGEVKEKETWELVNEERDRLTFRGQLWGLEAFAHYTFSVDEGMLIGASYRIENGSLSKREGKEIGEKVTEKLKRKYGKPHPDIFYSETEVRGSVYPLYRIMEWEDGKIRSSIIVGDKKYKLTIDVEYIP